MRTGRSSATFVAFVVGDSSLIEVFFVDFLDPRLGVVLLVVGAGGGVVGLVVPLRRVDFEVEGEGSAGVLVPFRRVFIGEAV